MTRIILPGSWSRARRKRVRAKLRATEIFKELVSALAIGLDAIWSEVDGSSAWMEVSVPGTNLPRGSRP